MLETPNDLQPISHLIKIIEAPKAMSNLINSVVHIEAISKIKDGQIKSIDNKRCTICLDNNRKNFLSSFIRIVVEECHNKSLIKHLEREEQTIGL